MRYELHGIPMGKQVDVEATRKERLSNTFMDVLTAYIEGNAHFFEVQDEWNRAAQEDNEKSSCGCNCGRRSVCDERKRCN